MKYPLAIVNQLLDQYGADIRLGYDIMCAFIKTLGRSSLRAKMVALHLQGVVPTFHGHAHNRCCQVDWHPMYMEGIGLEDFEECECTFKSPMNLLQLLVLPLPSTVNSRLMSTSSFTIRISMQCQACTLTIFRNPHPDIMTENFIFQNYRQALERIESNSKHLSLLASKLGTTADDYETYLKSEHEYLKDLHVDPVDVIQKAKYIDHLIKLYHFQQGPLSLVHSSAYWWSCRGECDRVRVEFQQLNYNIIHNGYTCKQITNVKTWYQTTYTQWVRQNEEVCEFEKENCIETHWTTTSAEYNDALVQRACEPTDLSEVTWQPRVSFCSTFTKLGMSGVSMQYHILHRFGLTSHMSTGYKLQEKIEKALRTCADMIRHALKAYNMATAQLNPPCPQLT